MESPDQEIEYNKRMAKEYYRISNIFTFLCCCTGIPFLLIGTFEFNSKATRCRRRIRELEEQKQQTQDVIIIHCQSCGHGIKEVITFCPLCGVEIDRSYAEEQKQIILPEKMVREIESILQIDSEKLAMKRRRSRGKLSIGFGIFVLGLYSWLSIFISPITIMGCIFNIAGIVLSITIIKYERKLAVAGIVLNAVSILVVVVMIILAYTVFFSTIFLPV
jgi:hypothetical protein